MTRSYDAIYSNTMMRFSIDYYYKIRSAITEFRLRAFDFPRVVLPKLVEQILNFLFCRY